MEGIKRSFSIGEEANGTTCVAHSVKNEWDEESGAYMNKNR
jgi:hypothetical protein